MKQSFYWIYFFAFLCSLSLRLSNAATAEACEPSDDSCPATQRVDPETCSLVYAPLLATPTNEGPDNGDNSRREWGVFSLTDRSKGQSVGKFGDVVVQIPDANEELSNALDLVWWDAQETGGQYEGHQTTHTIVPGLGMMARPTQGPANLLPFVPRVDEGGLTRFESPGAGAITHYHNYTWFIRENVLANSELFMSSSLAVSSPTTNNVEKHATTNPDLETLLLEGYCLDNLRPRKSRIKDAGRGAFATRSFSAGEIIAPVPVLPLSSSSLTTKPTPKSSSGTRNQLLQNYCLGNTNSSTLLYPYGRVINLINHYPQANVKLQWSQESVKHLSHALSLDEPPFLLMELVAIKAIREGEEVYFDYGKEWEKAWWEHKQTWKASDKHYTPSYVMDDAIRLLRTQQEQKDHEYPDNLFTSCFYKYSDRDESDKAMEQFESADKVTGFQWKFTKGLYELKNLRPCEVLRRAEDSKGRSAYAVRMWNRPGLPEKEIIPKGALHIVTHVPRQAIRFSDKPGSADPYLPGAFRQEIGLTEEIFPAAWMDLRMDVNET